MLDSPPESDPGRGRVVEKTAPLTGLYAPIVEDVARVEAIIQAEIAHPNPFVTALVQQSTRFQGKRIRPALLLYSSYISGGAPRDLHHSLAAVIEILHTATLAHDDVLDEADLRRNVKTLNRMWGNEAPVLFGDYLFAKAYTLCARLHNREANLIFAQAVQDICVGELSQISGRFNFDLDEPAYLELIRQKTAVLFSAACRLGAVDLDPRHVVALAEFGEKFGLAFQIVDDCLDLTGEEREMGKTLGTDLGKGKLTLPLLRLLRTPHRKTVEKLLTSRNGVDPRVEVRKLLLEHDAIGYAFGRAQEMVDEAKAALAVLPPSVYTENLAGLADFAVARRV